MTSAALTYVLITPARNEERLIQGTLDSVCSQTVLPRKWIVVSDGSADRTDELVTECAARHPWIELVRRPPRSDRHFAAKVQCFNAGYERLRDVDYDIIGNLDADITFEPDYLEFLLGKFAEDAALGVAGTPFRENFVQYDYRFASIEHVSGACQLFRRQCFEEIGGYRPVRGGGIDWIAVTTARMKGWKTRSFLERACDHHRPMGTATATPLRALYKLGTQDYFLGGHPVWQCCRGVFQMRRRPYIAGGAALLAGYFIALIRRVEKPVPLELVRFHRREQMQRLRDALLSLAIVTRTGRAARSS
jgi:biofilm PGA synthesis N-glycosyltransferase PgaC